MGFRARKSIKVAPGVKVNIGKKSVGVSVGGKHGGVSVNSKKGVNTRASIPGTGISYTNHISSSKKSVPNHQKQRISPAALRVLGIILIITAAVCVGVGIYISDMLSPAFLYVIGSVCGLLGLVYFWGSFKKQP